MWRWIAIVGLGVTLWGCSQTLPVDLGNSPTPSPTVDPSLPGVSGVIAAAGDREVTLDWTNPATGDEVIVAYGDSSFPTDPSLGTVTCSGAFTSQCIDTTTENTTTRFYSLFVRHGGALSAPADIEASTVVAGTIDPRLGNNGTLTLDRIAGFAGDDVWNAVTLMPSTVTHNNEPVLIVAGGGRGDAGTTGSDAVAGALRTTDGLPAMTFGTNGLQVVRAAVEGEQYFGVAVNAAERIMLVGEFGDGFSTLTNRIRADGTTDSAYFTGTVGFNDGVGAEGARGVVTEGGTTAYMAGFQSFGNPFAQILFSAINDTQITTAQPGTGGTDNSRANAIAWQGANLLLAGRFTPQASTDGNDMRVWRIDTAGVVDTSYGANGFAEIASALDEEARAVIHTSFGVTVAAGCQVLAVGAGNRLSIWTFDVTGTFLSGATYTSLESCATGIIEQPDRRVVVSGWVIEGGDEDAAAWRFLVPDSAAVTLDPNFGVDGISRLVSPGADERAHGIAGMPNDDGAALVGFSDNGANTDASVWYLYR